MKVGITIILDKNTNVFSNGIFQNIILMQELLEKCDGVERCYLINVKNLKKEDYAGSFWAKYSDVLLTKAEAEEICDIHIVCHGFYTGAECRNLRNKGKKLVKHVMGASLASFVESITTPQDVKLCGTLEKIKYDAVWVSPHYFQRDKDFYKVMHDCPVHIGPYIWDPRFIEEHVVLSAPFDGYKPNGELAKRISTAEPNLNFTKTCVIPITITELLERQRPELLKCLSVYGSDRIKKNKDMIDWVANFDIYQRKKCWFEARFPLVTILKKTDIMLCHQNQNELNYLHLDAAWLGYPVVHNSPMMVQLGWYYPENDTEKAIEHIEYIAENFDAIEHPNNAYLNKSRIFASRYLPTNPDNINGYESLIKELFDKNVKHQKPKKMFAMYKADDLPALEANHRKYCDAHGIEFNKKLITNSVSEKYAYILACMQKNIDSTLIFIDDLSYFNCFNRLPEMTTDILIQKDGESVLDNFFIVNSNHQTIELFSKAHRAVRRQEFPGISVTNFPAKSDKENSLNINLPDSVCVKYPFVDGSGVSLNLKLVDSLKHNSNTLVVNLTQKSSVTESNYFADAACYPVTQKYIVPKEKFECFNPGKPTALITLYTDNIKDSAIISEENIKKYCALNDITFYIYRDVPDNLKQQNMSGNWAKPWLLLNHFDRHLNIGWIDSDILIGKEYKLDTASDIAVYEDPATWRFNSGFMMFKTSEKNKAMISSVVDKIISLGKSIDTVYANGGDQLCFIRAFEEAYPNYSPKSYLLGNSHPCFPKPLSPYLSDTMVHFMGFSNLRVFLMRAYNEVLLKAYSKDI